MFDNVEDFQDWLYDYTRLFIAVLFSGVIVLSAMFGMLRFSTHDSCKGKAHRIGLTCSSVTWNYVEQQCECTQKGAQAKVAVFSSPYLWD